MARLPILSPQEHALVSAAVSAAEANSAGEIVTIVADRSDGYSDIALAWSAAAALLALVSLAAAPEPLLALYERLSGGWLHEWHARGLFGLALGAASLAFAIVWLLLLWQPLRFAMIPGAVKAARVRARAVSSFRIGAERRTHGRTGILIYLSMREHRAEIVADEAIATRVTPDVWGEAMAAMIARIRERQVAQGMVEAIGRVGKVLAAHFPRAGDDQNELPDRLIEV